MSKVLLIDYEKCVGCLTCTQACSVKHTGTVNPLLSRIAAVKLQMGIECINVVCMQCESAACEIICPAKAISLDELLGRKVVDYDICIGCKMCMTVCPFGCMNFDSINKRVFKCELCDGDPICVKFCQYDALQYIEPSEQVTMKRTVLAEKVSTMINKISSAIDSNLVK